MADTLSSSLPSIRMPPPPPPPDTPLRSPKRRQQLSTDDQDPLLATLSPEAILDALASINAVPKHESRAKDILVRSMAQVSADDREIGTRAALAAQKLKTWLRELSSWKWPTGKDVHQGKGFLPPVVDSSKDSQEYCGSLPTQIVTQYETYLEEIRSGIDDLRIEDLKEHIINVHVPGRSRPSSANSCMSSVSAPPFTYTQLSDFATVITATILRALPTLARLNRLLNTWRVRFLVLRQVPGLLESIETARKHLDEALASLDNPEQKEGFSMHTFQSKKEDLRQYISVAGLRTDTILDALETCEDALPESWIDQMDALEADFVTWAQRAENIAFEREWKHSVVSEEQPPSKEEIPASSENVNTRSKSSADPKSVSTEHAAKHESASDATEDSVKVSEDVQSTNNAVVLMDDLHTPADTITETATIDATGVLEGHEQTQVDSSVTAGDSSAQFPSAVAPDAYENITPTPHIDSPTTNEDTSTTTVIKDEVSELENTIKQTFKGANNDDIQPTTDSPTHATGGSMGDPEIDEETDRMEMGKDSPPNLPTVQISTQREPESLPLPDPTIFPDETSLGINSEEELSSTEMVSDKQPILLASEKNEVLDTIYEVPLPSESEVSPASHDTENPSTPAVVKDEDPSMEETSMLQSDFPPPDSPIDTSTPQRLQTSSPHPVIAISKATEDIDEEAIEDSNGDNRSRSSANIDNASSPSLVESDSGPRLPMDRDIPIQSIEYPEEQSFDGNAFPSHRDFSAAQSSSVLVETPDLTIHSSPGVVSNDSDRTLRDKLSPKLDDSILQRLQIFKHNDKASLPLQRFINDETDTSFPVENSYRESSFSTPGRSSDSPRFLQKSVDITSSRKDSESPPPDAIPRRAVRGPSSSLMRGTISSLNKVVGNTPRHQSDSISADIGNSRLHPRYRAVSKDVDSDSVSLNRKMSNNSLLSARNAYLRSRPSMESIGSYVSSADLTEKRRKYSFSTDGGSFAMRPVNETDDDLQEKIHSILTGIPGQIRLSNNPATDFDQRSVVSSVSASVRNQFGSRSPYSTPSRAGTPTPSGSFTPSSRPKRTTSYKSEDKTVRVYHLHHRGKTQPTKLFVRTVGEDGERVMVRVGGGWADLREYLREYVIHHSRQTPSRSQVEVKGLPTSTSPGSATAHSAENTPSAPRPSSAMSNRPGSSLSVRKTRRPSKAASDLPAFTAENIDAAEEGVQVPSFPPARRGSVSSLNSVSMSSMLGDGSSVYSSLPGSARTPHTQGSTPLGLAGPKPRTRHVSMTPESEAWVEDVIGQARRTSSNIKTTPKATDPRIDREHHNSSRMSVRSVSDIGAVGRNKRVSLKGLGAHERS